MSFHPSDPSETLTMNTTQNKRAYRKPVLKRLGLLRKLTRYTF